MRRTTIATRLVQLLEETIANFEPRLGASQGARA